MISPSFSSPLPLPLFCLLFIMLGIPVSLTTPDYEREYEHLFQNCRNGTFKCGNITAGFPFRGGDREKECGHRDLELQCDSDITTMEIHGVRYRVLEIRPDRQILGISTIANNSNIHPERCSDSANTSILQNSLERLRNSTLDWKGALKTGFEVQWGKNYSEECWKCNSSGGACGFNFYDDQAFYCYCPPGNSTGHAGKEWFIHRNEVTDNLG
ncbi:hypothetical protein GOBAR_AA07001 [Gossypium barbadense]|uniref:non-specific serine/threonine protein kinase n=1 Tax=Gossypium barbadense TaxID=3634 RepID=A0A2P5YD92_GOSBA|nr:hypothetical protein GOBAR_AA07001 [Gossypium barbadense]